MKYVRNRKGERVLDLQVYSMYDVHTGEDRANTVTYEYVRTP